MKNKIGVVGAFINAVSVLLFAVCMIISYDFGSYFVCIFLALSFIMMAAAFEAECNRNTQAAGKAASVFAGIYAALVFIVYFTQCTTVQNEALCGEAAKFLNYNYMGLLFNLDLLGYAMMALSTFFIGLTIEAKNKKDKALKALLLIHGVFFISCLLAPMTGIFVGLAGEGAAGGTTALELWCAYFLPVSLLSLLHFRAAEQRERAADKDEQPIPRRAARTGTANR